MAEDIRNIASTAGVKEFEASFSKPHCILMDSEYCSMGRMIGNIACNKSGYTYYDAVILLELVKDSGISIEDVETYEKKLRKPLNKEDMLNDADYIKIKNVFDKAIDIALAKGPCLIHDRSVKEYVKSRGYSCLSVMIYATDMKSKFVRARISPLYKDIDNDECLTEKIHEEDTIRINYHSAQSDTTWGDKNSYDLCLNSEVLGRDFAAEMLAKCMG